MRGCIQMCGLMIFCLAVQSVQSQPVRRKLATQKRYNLLRSAPPGNWIQRDARRDRPPVGLPSRRKLLPESVVKYGLDNLHIPNNEFCSIMQMDPSEQYFLLPWWYHYCQKLAEVKNSKIDKNDIYYLPLYQQVLDRVSRYKRLQLMKNL